jgi:hypothetical protein
MRTLARCKRSAKPFGKEVVAGGKYEEMLEGLIVLKGEE